MTDPLRTIAREAFARAGGYTGPGELTEADNYVADAVAAAVLTQLRAELDAIINDPTGGFLERNALAAVRWRLQRQLSALAVEPVPQDDKQHDEGTVLDVYDTCPHCGVMQPCFIHPKAPCAGTETP